MYVKHCRRDSIEQERPSGVGLLPTHTMFANVSLEREGVQVVRTEIYSIGWFLNLETCEIPQPLIQSM